MTLAMGNPTWERKRVAQYDKDGTFIRMYSSVTAVKAYGFDPSSVTKCCRGERHHAHNYVWRYATPSQWSQTPTEQRYLHRRPKHNQVPSERRKRVAQYTTDGTLIKTYDYLRAVKADNYNPSVVSKCCNGKRPTAYNYKWEYI